MATTLKFDQITTNRKQFKSIVSGLINDPRTPPRLSFADVVNIMRREDHQGLAKHLAALKLSSKSVKVDISTEIPIIKVSDFSTEVDRSLLLEPPKNWREMSYDERLMIASESENFLQVPGCDYPLTKHSSFDAAYMYKNRKTAKPSSFSSYYNYEGKIRPEKFNSKRRFSDGYNYPKIKFSSRARMQPVNSCALMPNQIYRLGQTKLYWRSMPAKASEGTVLADSSHRDRLIILFCSNFTGNHKLQPLVIGSSSDPRVVRNFEAFVNYKYSKDCQITMAILNEWFFDHFVPEVSKYSKKHDLPQRSMLTVDPSVNRIPPLSQLVSDKYQIKTVKLNNNITEDKTVVGLARIHYKKRLLLDAVAYPHQFTKLSDAVSLIRLSWDEVKSYDIHKCCQYILPSEDKSIFAEYDPTAMLRAMQLQKNCIMEIEELLAHYPGGKELVQSEIDNWIYFDQGLIINKNPFF